MKTKFLIFVVILFSKYSFGQSCNCTNELDFVVKYYEANLPGFMDNVNDKNRNEYEKFKKELFLKSKNINLKSECFKLLTYYVEFFKDNHSRMDMDVESVNEKDENLVKTFLNSETFKTSETYQLKKTDFKQYPLNDIRGIYQTSDSMYTIAIIPNKGSLRKYIGVITDSKTPLWVKGQVKLELNPNKKGGYEVFMYRGNHSLRFSPNYILSNGILGDNWFKTSLKKKVSYNLNNSNTLEFKILNDSTSYVRIPSFSGGLSAKIDSFYMAIDAQIQSKPYLIIDVRNNGGGSDRNASPLLKYIYTKPFAEDIVDLYVTEGNIKMWELWYEKINTDTINYNKEVRKKFLDNINKMKKAPLNSFLLKDKDTIKRDKVLSYPKKVVIIANKYCASSCETLLFWAKESDKTILVGENSGGYVGYGEVGSINTPCYEFTLYCTMTRYRKQRAFEVTGIPPNVRLNNRTDWINQTLDILTKNKK